MRWLVGGTSVFLRTIGLVTYAGASWLAVSTPIYDTWLQFNFPDVSNVLQDRTLADIWAVALGMILLLLLLYSLLVRLITWREAINEIGNVASEIAVHGFERALGIRDRSRAVHREAVLVGVISVCVAVAHVLSFGIGNIDPNFFEPLRWPPQMKVGTCGLLLVIGSLASNPQLELVSQVAAWLNRRVRM